MIHHMMWLYKCQIRALAQRIHDRLARHDTVLLGRDRLCQNHSVARLDVSDNHDCNIIFCCSLLYHFIGKRHFFLGPGNQSPASASIIRMILDPLLIYV